MSWCDAGWLVWTGFFRPQGGARRFPTWHGARTTVAFSEFIPPNLKGTDARIPFAFLNLVCWLVWWTKLFYILPFSALVRANKEKSMITSVADPVFIRGAPTPGKAFITARKRSLRRLCFHRCLSVQGGLSLCAGEVSVQGSLSRGGVSVHGVSVQRSLSRGVSVQGEFLSRGVSVQGNRDPHTVMNRQYAS